MLAASRRALHQRCGMASHFRLLSKSTIAGVSPDSYSSSLDSSRSLVLTHTAQTDVSGVKLRLITKSCALYRETDESSLPFEAPWWAFCWPGGRGLTRFVLENPERFQGKRVLDVGSGCGSVSIACAMVGAREVVANDVDVLAGVALSINAELNAVNSDVISFLQENRIGAGKKYFDAFDVVLVGDMLYDPDFSPLLLSDLANHGGVYFGDPGRTYCPADVPEEHLLASYDYQEDGFNSIRVFKLS